MTTQQPEAMRLAEMLTADEWPGSVTLVSYARECVAELRRQHARITELESQLAQRFDAADMATASAQGFRDGVASLSANAGGPRNAIDRDALIDAIAQGLHRTWHCTRVWEAWHVGTMSQDDFEPVDESETPAEIADAVLALLAAPPTAQAEVWTATAQHQTYRCKIKSRKQIDKKIPRDQQGWWADVAAGQKLLLRPAVQADIDRCRLDGGLSSKNPDDYMCETQTNGSLVSKIALEYMNPEENVFAAVPPPPTSAEGVEHG